ncbi:uncharacterized protein VP01_4413g1, partial [Puccinia sorghi]
LAIYILNLDHYIHTGRSQQSSDPILLEQPTSSDGIELSIATLSTHSENIDAFLTGEKLLKTKDIYTAAFILMLPTDFLSCVLSLLHKDHHLSATIVTTLRSECLLSGTAPSNFPPLDDTLLCLFCHRSGHRINLNENPAVILEHCQSHHCLSPGGHGPLCYPGNNFGGDIFLLGKLLLAYINSNTNHLKSQIPKSHSFQENGFLYHSYQAAPQLWNQCGSCSHLTTT